MADDRDLVLINGTAGGPGTEFRQALAEDFRVVGMDLECDPDDEDCYEFDLRRGPIWHSYGWWGRYIV